MLTTVRAAAPRNGVSLSWLTGPVRVIAGTSRGMGDSIGDSIGDAEGDGADGEVDGEVEGEVEGDGGLGAGLEVGPWGALVPIPRSLGW
ncbi:MAG TPA: hypothetical protein VFF32_09670 [Dermatophilaceae bacterium]|nr:hypothetical protein [Dermatophilaceae bacterium]